MGNIFDRIKQKAQQVFQGVGNFVDQTRQNQVQRQSIAQQRGQDLTQRFQQQREQRQQFLQQQADLAKKKVQEVLFNRQQDMMARALLAKEGQEKRKSQLDNLLGGISTLANKDTRGQYFNPESGSEHNFWKTHLAQNMAKVQPNLEGRLERGELVKPFEVKEEDPFATKAFKRVANFPIGVTNVPTKVLSKPLTDIVNQPASLIKTGDVVPYEDLKSPGSKLAYQAMGVDKTPTDFRDVAGNVTELMSDFYNAFAFDRFSKPGTKPPPTNLKQAAFDGMKTGSKYGGLFAFFNSLNKNTQDKEVVAEKIASNVAFDTVVGVATGAVAGATIGIAGYGFGKLVNPRTSIESRTLTAEDFRRAVPPGAENTPAGRTALTLADNLDKHGSAIEVSNETIKQSILNDILNKKTISLTDSSGNVTYHSSANTIKAELIKMINDGKAPDLPPEVVKMLTGQTGNLQLPSGQMTPQVSGGELAPQISAPKVSAPSLPIQDILSPKVAGFQPQNVAPPPVQQTTQPKPLDEVLASKEITTPIEPSVDVQSIDTQIKKLGAELGKVRAEIATPKPTSNLDALRTKEAELRSEYSNLMRTKNNELVPPEQQIDYSSRGKEIVDYAVNKGWKGLKGKVLDAGGGGAPAKYLPEDVRQPFADWRNQLKGANTEGVYTGMSVESLNDKGTSAFLEYQAGDRTGDYAKVEQIMNDLYQREQEAGITYGQQDNYLYQAWEDSDSIVRQKLGEYVGSQPSFTQERFLENYQAGIDAGLTPKFKTMEELIRARVNASLRAIANKEYFADQLQNGVIAPVSEVSGDSNFAKLISSPDKIMLGDKEVIGPFAAPKPLARVINNVTQPPSPLLEIPARIVSKSKNIILSSGVPNTGLSFQGWNMNSKALQAGGMLNIPKNQLKTGDFLLRPNKALEFTREHSADMIEFTTKSDFTSSTEDFTVSKIFDKESTDSIKRNLPDKVATAIIDWQENTFEKPLFGKALPAIKLQYAMGMRDKLINQGMGRDEAIKIAGKSANDIFGGKNLEAIGRGQDFQNILRSFILAPDWTETHIGTGTGVIKGVLNPKDKNYKPFRQLLGGIFGLIVLQNLAQKALTGEFSFQNKEKDKFNIRTGIYLKDGTEFILRPFGNSLDWLRIPYEIVAGLFKGDPSPTFRALRNRLSPQASSILTLLTNVDYKGDSLYGRDRYGQMIPPEKAVYNITRELAGNYLPTFIESPLDAMLGEKSWAQAATEVLEIPARYDRVAYSDKEKFLAKQLNESGKSGEEVREILSSNKKVTAKDPKEDNWLKRLFSGKDDWEVPSKDAGKQEMTNFNDKVSTSLQAGVIPPQEALKDFATKGKDPFSNSIEEKQDAFSYLEKEMTNEFYSDEVKEALLKASEVDPDDYYYYERASKTNLVKLQEILPEIDQMDEKEMMVYLMQGRKTIAGKLVIADGVVDELYEMGYLTKDQKNAIKALKYNEITGEFNYKRDYSGKSSSNLTYKQAMALFKIDLPKFSEIKSPSPFSKPSAKGSATAEKTLDEILNFNPKKQTSIQDQWFKT